MKTTFKSSVTLKDYPVEYNGYSFVIPAGSRVSNQTACGPDDSYRFWTGWQSFVRDLTGFPDSMLAHDLTYYGLNIPAEYCEAYSDLGKGSLSSPVTLS